MRKHHGLPTRLLDVDEKKKAAMELLPTIEWENNSAEKMNSTVEKRVREFWKKEGLTNKSVEHETYRSMLAIENILQERGNCHEDWPDTSIEWDRTIKHVEKNFPDEIKFCKIIRKVKG